jgi:hypothetical protein
VSTAVDIALKVGVPVLTFALGRAWPRAVAEFKYRRTKHFWRPIARSEPTVIVATHQLPNWEASSLMSTEEAKAIDELRAHFRSLYLKQFQVTFADEIPRGRVLDGTLLLLGGPDTSPLSLRTWRSVPTTFVWGDPERHDISIHDKQTGTHYVPAGFRRGEVTRDWALVVRMPNPFAQPEANRWVLLFAGCLGYGTLAAVRFATSPAFVAHPFVAKAESFECLLSVEVVSGAPQRIELVEARRLTRDGQDQTD